jgi:hypothetical protein
MTQAKTAEKELTCHHKRHRKLTAVRVSHSDKWVGQRLHSWESEVVLD